MGDKNLYLCNTILYYLYDNTFSYGSLSMQFNAFQPLTAKVHIYHERKRPFHCQPWLQWGFAQDEVVGYSIFQLSPILILINPPQIPGLFNCALPSTLVATTSVSKYVLAAEIKADVSVILVINEQVLHTLYCQYSHQKPHWKLMI